MGSSPIMHPSLLSRLALFYPDTVTIQVNTPTADSYGEMIPSWANKASHIDLDCSVASEPKGREMKRPDGTIAYDIRRIAIAGHYTGILATMRAVVSGTNYDILAIQHDSHSETTYLSCEVIT